MISLDTGLTADAIDLGYDADGVFYQTTPAYGGKILAHIVILEQRPQMATVHPKMFTPLAPDAAAKAKSLRRLFTLKQTPIMPLWSMSRMKMSRSISPSRVLLSQGPGNKERNRPRCA